MRRVARRRVVRQRAAGSVEADRAAQHRTRRASSLPAWVLMPPRAGTARWTAMWTAMWTAVRTVMWTAMWTAMWAAVRAPSPMRRRPRKLVTPRLLLKAAVVARWLVAPRPGLLVVPGMPVAHLLLLRGTLRCKALPVLVHGRRPAG